MRLKIITVTLLVGISFWLSSLITTPEMPQEGTAPILYSNVVRDDLKLLFLYAIDHAQTSVFLKIYSLRDPKLIQSLKEKAESGVSVTVICDGKASKGVQQKLGPAVDTVYRNDRGIMHQKILITDQESIWIGSANFTTKSLRVHSNLVVGLYSPELAAWITEHHQQPGNETFEVGGQEVEIWITRDNPDAVERLAELLQSAKKTMRVAMFTWTRMNFAQEVSKANLRGVKTAVILDRNASRGSGKKVANFLDDNGIPVAISTGPGLMHHKLLWIDRATLAVGSANWTKAAFSINTDCYLVLHDLTQTQRNKLKRIWKTQEVESQLINNY